LYSKFCAATAGLTSSEQKRPVSTVISPHAPPMRSFVEKAFHKW
jgi:hypothetical protein